MKIPALRWRKMLGKKKMMMKKMMMLVATGQKNDGKRRTRAGVSCDWMLLSPLSLGQMDLQLYS